MGSLKKVLNNTVLYSLSSILLRASSIILLPIFSKYLTKTDYGILNTTQSIVSLITIIAGLGLNSAVTRFIYNNAEKKSLSHDTLISSVLLTSVISNIIIIGFFLAGGKYLLSFFLNEISFYPYMFFFLASIPFTTVLNVARTFYRATHNGKKVFLIDTIFFSIVIVLNLFFIVILKTDVLGLILSNLIVSVGFAIYIYINFFYKLRWNLDKNLIYECLKYSIPLVPYSVIGMFFETSDRLFLNSFSGAEITGIYYFAITYTTVFSTIKESLITAITPWVFENINSKSSVEIENLLSNVFIGSGIIALSMTFFSKEVLYILSSNPEFIEAYKYIPFTIMSLFILFLGQLYNIKTYYYKKYIKYLSISTILGFITNLALCWILIPKYGVYGALISRLISFSVFTIVVIVLSRLEREKNDIYNLRIFIFTVLGLFTLSMVSLTELNIFTGIIIKLLIVLILFIIYLVILNKSYNITHKLKVLLKM